MKKLLLLSGIIASIATIASVEDTFNELFCLQESLIRRARFEVPQTEDFKYDGYIACDIINKFSQSERDYIKQKAVLKAENSLYEDDVLTAVILYNNIVQCEDVSSTLLSPGYFIRQAREKNLRSDGDRI